MGLIVLEGVKKPPGGVCTLPDVTQTVEKGRGLKVSTLEYEMDRVNRPKAETGLSTQLHVFGLNVHLAQLTVLQRTPIYTKLLKLNNLWTSCRARNSNLRQCRVSCNQEGHEDVIQQ